MKTLLFVHAFATLFMVGLIWFVQVVHYPLFAGVGEPGFPAYEQQHSRLTTYVVAPIMLAELAAAVLLVLWRPSGVAPGWLWAGLGLLGIVWLSTFLFQVPQHNILMQGFDAQAHQRLVTSNWLRTICWSARGVIALRLLAQWKG